jgi:hypothetical protein
MRLASWHLAAFLYAHAKHKGAGQRINMTMLFKRVRFRAWAFLIGAIFFGVFFIMPGVREDFGKIFSIREPAPRNHYEEQFTSDCKKIGFTVIHRNGEGAVECSRP